MSQELIQQLFTALTILALAFFRQNQSGREEIAHAAFDILGKLGKKYLTHDRALELLVATGLLSQTKAKRFVTAVIRRREGNQSSLFEEEIIPGVLVTVSGTGEVFVQPRGLLNRLAHRLNKWSKTNLGLQLF